MVTKVSESFRKALVDQLNSECQKCKYDERDCEFESLSGNKVYNC